MGGFVGLAQGAGPTISIDSLMHPGPIVRSGKPLIGLVSTQVTADMGIMRVMEERLP